MLLLLYALVFWPRGMWDLSSPTRGQACTLNIGRQSPNHPTAREVPVAAIVNQCCSAVEKNRMEHPQKIKNRTSIRSGAIPLLGQYVKEMKTGHQKDACMPMFIAALCTNTRGDEETDKKRIQVDW